MSSARHDCRHIRHLATLLADGQVDAAIEAGLMEADPRPDCADCAHADLPVRAAQRRLHDAWAARERYRARAARLARRAAERQRRRAPATAPSSAAGGSALPPTVAAALARAKARAAGTSNE